MAKRARVGSWPGRTPNLRGAVKYTIEPETFDALDEGIKGLYDKQEDGSFRLSVEGATSKAKLDEFRENNLSLAREKDRMAQELSKLVPPEKVNEIAERLAQERTEHLNQRLTQTLVEKHIAALAGTSGVRPEALEDVMRRAHDVFKVAGDGKLVPRSATGDDLNDPSALLKPEEWLSSLKTTHPHYFAASNGGGSTGSSRDSHGRFKTESKIRFKEDLVSTAAKSAFIREHGFKAWEELPLKHKPNPYQQWQKKHGKEQQE
ncbi:hypothetical protein [Dongia deserti]|uniref:hypothetical protein n=1 Tax=Dongia deserti TaxID=2268030 RepID=UPI000E64FF2B|nr:hypothetical protein [Dongia deserti]